MINNYYAVETSSAISHHGVKGMKWGVRKARPQTLSRPARYRTDAKPRTPEEQKRARRRKILKRAALGAAAAAAVVGTAYAVKRVNARRDRDASELARAGNLMAARGTTNKDWNTFNQRRGEYTKGQYRRIASAYKYGDANDFSRAVNARHVDRDVYARAARAGYSARRAVRNAASKIRRK